MDYGTSLSIIHGDTLSSDLFKHEIQTELDDTTEFCYQLIITLTNFVIYNRYKALFKIKTQEIPRFFWLAMKKRAI